ncbi:MAG TPA: transposase [Vicinamibacterales bacterium]|nr:transposase [Vicinamibacterales bacterium]
MTHPYPPHHPRLPYLGRHHYFLTFVTDARRPVFLTADTVDLVWRQIANAAARHRMEITAYCFMPDHLHLTVNGLHEASDCKAFIKAAKQYSGYHFGLNHRCRLWQRYCFERVLRDARECALAIGYIVANPVRSGLVEHPSEYPHLGSQRYQLHELLEICEYRDGWS